MTNFTKIQIYCKAVSCCFDDIKNSKKPHITININEISSLEPKEDWGFCTGHSNYPYRRLEMNNGTSYLCVLESANELEKLLIRE